MSGVKRLVEIEVKKEIKVQLGLVYSDIAELKKDHRELKQKYFDLKKYAKKLKEDMEKTDFGV